MTDEKKYASSLDNIAKYLPWVIVLFVLITLGSILLRDSSVQANTAIFASIIPVVLVLGIIFPMYATRTLYIAITDGAILIARKWWPATIPFSDIISIKKIDNMRFVFRTFGNGGLFGYTGKYYKRGIGSMTWYCTQRKNYILIETTDGKKTVITPDDPDGFMKDIEHDYPLLVTGPITPAA